MGACKPAPPAKYFFLPRCLMILSQMNPQVPPGNSGTLLAREKKPVYPFGILPADGQGMGFQRHWVLVLPDPLAGFREEGPNGSVSCRVPWAGRPGFVTPDLKRCSGCERCWGSCLALLAAKSGPQALLPQIKNRLFFFFFLPSGPCPLGRGVRGWTQQSAERLQGALPGSVCQSPSPPPTAPGLFLPGPQVTNVKGDRGRSSAGFMVAPSGQLPHGAHNTVPREKNRLTEEGKGTAKVTQAAGGET